jgi:hypothetical protein
VEGQDFILLPWLAYDALAKWYGIKSDSIPLKVIAGVWRWFIGIGFRFY